MSQLLETQFIFSINFSLLLQFLREKQYHWSMGEGLRTKEQAELYAKQGKGIINSQHCKKLAEDINLFNKDETGKYKMVDDKEFYKQAGVYWKSLNDKNRWGGDFTSLNDPYHFEMQE